MKWVNLADRQPPTNVKAPILRRISDKSTTINGIFHLTHETPRRWTIWDPKHNTRIASENFSSYEWLDESEDIPEGFVRIDVPIGSQVISPKGNYRPPYPTLEYVALTEIHDDLIEKYETLLAKYNKLKNKK